MRFRGLEDGAGAQDFNDRSQAVSHIVATHKKHTGDVDSIVTEADIRVEDNPDKQDGKPEEAYSVLVKGVAIGFSDGHLPS